MSYNGIEIVGNALHVHPKPCRLIGSSLQGWARVGSPDDHEYQCFFGTNFQAKGFRWNGFHLECDNPGCNRRDLRRFRIQDKVDWTKVDSRVSLGFI